MRTYRLFDVNKFDSVTHHIFRLETVTHGKDVVEYHCPKQRTGVMRTSLPAQVTFIHLKNRFKL
jgi:hypothetical protein